MSVSIFDSFLTTPDMIAVFDDAAILQAMLRFVQALPKAHAYDGLVPATVPRSDHGKGSDRGVFAAGQIRSITIAIPCPTPIHMVHKA